MLCNVSTALQHVQAIMQTVELIPKSFVQLSCIAVQTHVACQLHVALRMLQGNFTPYVPLQVSGLKSSTSGSLAAFERMEQKVVAMESEADAVGQVGTVYTLLCT